MTDHAEQRILDHLRAHNISHNGDAVGTLIEAHKREMGHRVEATMQQQVRRLPNLAEHQAKQVDYEAQRAERRQALRVPMRGVEQER